MIAHCLFEQSGTFKNEFIKLGFLSYDYDILNDYGETDFQVDLFSQISAAYELKDSIFDSFDSSDILFCFFPCVRFEDQIQLHFRGTASQLKHYSDLQKLDYDILLHNQLHEFYVLFCKLCHVILSKGLRAVIENPYSSTHYLTKYFALRPSVIDSDRRLDGDSFKKPTQYWFLGFHPATNLVFEPLDEVPYFSITDFHGSNRTAARSLITSQYANRFIRRYILNDNFC